MKEYQEFPNLCFVDTLDSVEGLRKSPGQQEELFGALSQENYARIKRQNKKKISIVIGNPPYNANQLNENDNNKNRQYPEIDRRIKETYVAMRDSHKTKTYDMYVRFIRWASDRIEDNGIIAFITNRSFIDKRAFDGFRKTLAKEFSDLYIIDLGGDVRDGESRSEGNIFDIKVGVAISFLIRDGSKRAGHVHIFNGAQGSREKQLGFLNATPFSKIVFDKRQPDAGGDWAELDRGQFSTFLPLTLPKLSGKSHSHDRDAIFKLASFGSVSNRDDWVYGSSPEAVEKKVKHYLSVYNAQVKRLPMVLPKDWESKLDYQIKWTQDLRRKAAKRVKLQFHPDRVVQALYRPFVKRSYYFDGDLNWSLYRMPSIFPDGSGNNKTIFFSDRGARAPFSSLVSDRVGELHLCASTDGFQSVPLYEFKDGERLDNVTDWALEKFTERYKKNESRTSIRKEDIFHYIYAVLHDPIYREKYSDNLKREFPRIPLYENFWMWAELGKNLMLLHIGFDEATPWPLKRKDAAVEENGVDPKVLLKADQESGEIRLDDRTTLSGIPTSAWNYRLGNRSAIEWVLDQYKQKSPKDPTVRERFDTYRFADHKQQVIDLIKRVTRVSVETVKIVEEMRVLGENERAI